jgi:subtilisin family serine protease
MKNLLLTLLLLFLAASLVHSCGEPLNTDQTEDYPDLKSAGKTSYIVILDDESIDTELSGIRGYEMKQRAMQTVASRVLNRAGIADGDIEFVYTTAVQGFSVKIPPGQLKKLQNDPSVTYVEEDQIVTIIGTQPGVAASAIQATGTQPFPWGITRVNGGVTYAGTGRAWIIDSGIDLDHPDLKVDTDKSRTFLGTNTTPDDQNGHGTHVAGTVAAINNDFGVIGVAAGAPVVSVRVLDRRGSGTISGVVAGVDYVAANAQEGDVANMSLGGGTSTTLDNAVKNAAVKCKFAIAAGNDGKDANNYSPARVNGTNIFTVSAMDKYDNWASWSNWGNPPVDYCAPGVSIYSTWKDGNYNTISGTSMAAPHVAGILLLGNIETGGYVNNDPDKNPDPIAVVGSTETKTGSLTGTVTDGTIGINGATVTIGNLSTNTDSDGSYSISKIPVGTYNVTATASGYTSLTENNITVSKDVTTIVNFILTEITSSEISLTAIGSKVKGVQKAELTWSGATGSHVKIYRNNVEIITDNDGSYTDQIGKVGGGTYIYKVCETGLCLFQRGNSSFLTESDKAIVEILKQQ